MLTDPIRELVAKVDAAEEAAENLHTGDEVLEVNNAVARAASFYEKVRYLIDYREEHTIRRAATERILKRKIFLERQVHVGVTLLQELVDGQYLPKEQATDQAAKDIDHIVWKFLTLINTSRVGGATARELIGFAATEIDARFSPLQYAIDESTVEAFYKTLQPHATVPGVAIETVNTELYCAAWRALLAADDERLAYALWLLYVPEWRSHELDIQSVAPKLSAVIRQIQAAVRHSLQWQLAQKIKNESIYFHIIRDIVQGNRAAAEDIFSSPSELEQHTRSILEKYYERENERIRSRGIRAVGYLFLTKMLVAVAVEVPYELFILGSLHYLPLSVNIFFHPLLLFMLTRKVTALDESNTQAVLKGVQRVLYEGKVRPIRVRNNYTRLTLIFGFIYLLLIMLVFGALIGVLELLQFNPVSIVLFLFFLALVSYFSFRIRFQAQRWKVVENRGALSLIGSVLAIPVVRVGRWLSQTFSSINVFVLIMDFIIETPFKRLLHFSTQFMVYLREKAEEIR